MGNKPKTIMLRVSTEFKALLVERAKFHHRTMTSYVEWLVLQDADPAARGPRTEPKNRRG